MVNCIFWVVVWDKISVSFVECFYLVFYYVFWFYGFIYFDKSLFNFVWLGVFVVIRLFVLKDID